MYRSNVDCAPEENAEERGDSLLIDEETRLRYDWSLFVIYQDANKSIGIWKGLFQAGL